MNEALVAAQQLRADSREQAQREAELVVKEARAEAQRILQQAQLDEVTVRERAEVAARQFTAYLAGFRGLLQRQLAELEVLEGLGHIPWLEEPGSIRRALAALDL